MATNVGGNGDIINDKNNCGILVEYGDKKAMAEAINTLMEDKRLYETYSKNAKKAVEEVFNLDVLLEDTYKKYF